jgi:pimeloyl-ACP methyl ester carboxylesterase
MALLARAAYGEYEPSPDWKKVAFPDGVVDTSGKASLYYNSKAQKYVLAFQGTDPLCLNDWWTNFCQGVGIDSATYDAARDLTGKVIEKIGKGNLEVVGHSLGGGLATAVALKYGLKATVFNPAGVKKATLARWDVDLATVDKSKITAYCVNGDALTMAQDKTIIGLLVMPQTVGTVEPLNNDHWYDSAANLTPVTGAALAVSKHLMGSVLRGLKYDFSKDVLTPPPPEEPDPNPNGLGLVDFFSH